MLRFFSIPAIIVSLLGVTQSGLEAQVLQDNDRVALIGNTFVERAQRYGQIESAMLLASDAKNLLFRNLGWSGDSVFNDARSYFGPPQEGRDRLVRAVSEMQPTVAFVCYGTGEAMSIDQSWTNEKNVLTGKGFEAHLGAFLKGYRQLLDNVQKAGGDNLRELILVTPPPLENLGPPLPDQIANNRNLARFAKAISELATERGLKVIDLFNLIGASEKVASPALTENGVHYGDAGYQMIARHWLKAMGLAPRDQLALDDKALLQLRETVIEKNRLFFHRWRPANETYLFLFRKHEQGNNAKEIPMFDPLIKAREARVEQLRSEIKKPSKPA